MLSLIQLSFFLSFFLSFIYLLPYSFILLHVHSILHSVACANLLLFMVVVMVLVDVSCLLISMPVARGSLCEMLTDCTKHLSLAWLIFAAKTCLFAAAIPCLFAIFMISLLFPDLFLVYYRETWNISHLYCELQKCQTKNCPNIYIIFYYQLLIMILN